MIWRNDTFCLDLILQMVMELGKNTQALFLFCKMPNRRVGTFHKAPWGLLPNGPAKAQKTSAFHCDDLTFTKFTGLFPTHRHVRNGE